MRNHDAAKEGFEVAINKFADLTPDEFEKLNGLRPIDTLSAFLNDEDADADTAVEETDVILGAPVSVDWRTSGAVTSVKN